jgi:hypothetical protein
VLFLGLQWCRWRLQLNDSHKNDGLPQE